MNIKSSKSKEYRPLEWCKNYCVTLLLQSGRVIISVRIHSETILPYFSMRIEWFLHEFELKNISRFGRKSLFVIHMSSRFEMCRFLLIREILARRDNI